VNSALPKAADRDSANTVLRRFIADYNRRFPRTPRDTAKAWRPAPRELDRICSFRHERIVTNDNVVQWEGRRFQIPPQNRRFTFAGAKIQLYQALDGRVSLYYGETRLETHQLHRGVTFLFAVRVTNSRCYNRAEWTAGQQQRLGLE